MDKQEIQRLLPHRGPMLLIEEAWLEEGAACARYTFRGEEWFFQGHFPDFPVVPGVVLCEILAQSTAILLDGQRPAGSLTYLTGLDKVRFRRSVRPGQTLETRCVITKARPPFYFARGEGRVAGELCVQAEFSFALAKG